MSRIHPVALAALTKKVQQQAYLQGFEPWMQTPWTIDGAVFTLVWDGAGPRSNRRWLVAATPLGGTVLGADVLEVLGDVKRLMAEEERAVDPEPEPEALVLSAEG